MLGALEAEPLDDAAALAETRIAPSAFNRGNPIT